MAIAVFWSLLEWLMKSLFMSPPPAGRLNQPGRPVCKALTAQREFRARPSPREPLFGTGDPARSNPGLDARRDQGGARPHGGVEAIGRIDHQKTRLPQFAFRRGN